MPQVPSDLRDAIRELIDGHTKGKKTWKMESTTTLLKFFPSFDVYAEISDDLKDLFVDLSISSFSETDQIELRRLGKESKRTLQYKHDYKLLEPGKRQMIDELTKTSSAIIAKASFVVYKRLPVHLFSREVNPKLLKASSSKRKRTCSPHSTHSMKVNSIFISLTLSRLD